MLTLQECMGMKTPFTDCPVLLITKFQIESFLYTMEAEKTTLAHCCRELFTIINITPLVVKAVVLLVRVPLKKFYVQKDNTAALIRDKTLPPKVTPCSKYYATRMIWFREEINKKKMALMKIST